MSSTKGKPIQLSSEEARRLILANTVLKSNALLSYTGFLPLFAWICPTIGGRSCGASEKRKCRDDSKEREKAAVEASTEDVRFDCFVEILEGRLEFLSRQMSRKGWKLNLDPIKWKGVKAKIH